MQFFDTVMGRRFFEGTIPKMVSIFEEKNNLKKRELILKEKELELKGKELKLKEKELELMKKD